MNVRLLFQTDAGEKIWSN